LCLCLQTPSQNRKPNILEGMHWMNGIFWVLHLL
jgi:hypothetical protein